MEAPIIWKSLSRSSSRSLHPLLLVSVSTFRPPIVNSSRSTNFHSSPLSTPHCGEVLSYKESVERLRERETASATPILKICSEFTVESGISLHLMPEGSWVLSARRVFWCDTKGQKTKGEGPGSSFKNSRGMKESHCSQKMECNNYSIIWQVRFMKRAIHARFSIFIYCYYLPG